MSEITPAAFHPQDSTEHDHHIDLTVDRDQHAGLVKSVRVQVPGLSKEDAEDAVQDAWIVLAEKADRLEPGPIGGYLRGTARNKGMKIREKGRRTTSLEALTEVAGDATSVLADHGFRSLDSHVELSELADDPIAARALGAANQGASPCVAPRGAHHRCARYTDEQVRKVRELRTKGLTYKRIEELTGVPAGYGPMLVRRASRITESTLWELEGSGPCRGYRARLRRSANQTLDVNRDDPGVLRLAHTSRALAEPERHGGRSGSPLARYDPTSLRNAEPPEARQSGPGSPGLT